MVDLRESNVSCREIPAKLSHRPSTPPRPPPTTSSSSFTFPGNDSNLFIRSLRWAALLPPLIPSFDRISCSGRPNWFRKRKRMQMFHFTQYTATKEENKKMGTRGEGKRCHYFPLLVINTLPLLVERCCVVSSSSSSSFPVPSFNNTSMTFVLLPPSNQLAKLIVAVVDTYLWRHGEREAPEEASSTLPCLHKDNNNNLIIAPQCSKNTNDAPATKTTTLKRNFFIDCQSTIKLGKITQFKELFSIKWHDDKPSRSESRRTTKNYVDQKATCFIGFKRLIHPPTTFTWHFSMLFHQIKENVPTSCQQQHHHLFLLPYKQLGVIEGVNWFMDLSLVVGVCPTITTVLSYTTTCSFPIFEMCWEHWQSRCMLLQVQQIKATIAESILVKWTSGWRRRRKCEQSSWILTSRGEDSMGRVEMLLMFF